MADSAELLAATGSACETTRGDYTGDGHLSVAAGASHNAFVHFLDTQVSVQRADANLGHLAVCTLRSGIFHNCTSEIVRVGSSREASLPKKIGAQMRELRQVRTGA